MSDTVWLNVTLHRILHGRWSGYMSGYIMLWMLSFQALYFHLWVIELYHVLYVLSDFKSNRYPSKKITITYFTVDVQYATNEGKQEVKQNLTKESNLL